MNAKQWIYLIIATWALIDIVYQRFRDRNTRIGTVGGGLAVAAFGILAFGHVEGTQRSMMVLLGCIGIIAQSREHLRRTHDTAGPVH